MVPLEIFVVMESAWKNDVFSGPSPVLPAGTNTSTGAIAPALAGAATYMHHDYTSNNHWNIELAHLIWLYIISNFFQILFGEHKANITLDVW